MKKRMQVNVALDEAEAAIIYEYCTVHDRTPQWLLKAGARRIIEDDILERRADLMTLQSVKEVESGLSRPLDNLLQMMGRDRVQGEGMAAQLLRKSA